MHKTTLSHLIGSQRRRSCHILHERENSRGMTIILYRHYKIYMLILKRHMEGRLKQMGQNIDTRRICDTPEEE